MTAVKEEGLLGQTFTLTELSSQVKKYSGYLYIGWENFISLCILVNTKLVKWIKLLQSTGVRARLLAFFVQLFRV